VHGGEIDLKEREEGKRVSGSGKEDHDAFRVQREREGETNRVWI